jgi:multicomponent Na+:H+ antiporter subunit G
MNSELLIIMLQLAGSFFFFSGAVGLLRFPDTLSRLHAITKADNLGLGFILLAAAVQQPSPDVIIRLILIWGATLAISATACHMVAMRVHPQSQISESCESYKVSSL